VRSRSLSSP